MKNFICLFFLLCISTINIVQASPAPLGLELDKAQLSEVKSKYSIIKKEKNIYSGYNYYIDEKNIPVDGLVEACLIFSDKQTLQGVILTMNKKRFDDIFQSLSKKYEVTSKIIPFVGDKLVELKDDDSLIMINAPHLSFDMAVSYVTKGLYDDFLNISNKNKQEKQDMEDSIL